MNIKDSNQTLRPAGNCFEYNGMLLIPFQDNRIHYAGGILFKNISFKNNLPQIGDIFFNLSIDYVCNLLKTKKIYGTHTYNRSSNYEVIDVLKSKFTIIGLLGKIRTKILKL